MISKEPLIKVANLSVVLEGNLIFRDLSFDLNENEKLVILGPNGAGKTVLIKALLGLLPYEGEVLWKPFTNRAYVPQRIVVNRDTPVSVLDFFKLKGISKELTTTILNRVGVSDENFQQKQLGILSSGQLQRVLIAWAMVKNPDVVLLDEPMAGVDLSGEDIIHSFLHQEAPAKTTTAILVTHDLNMVYGEATKVLCMNRHKFFIGSPVEVLDPKSLQEIYGREIQFIRHDHA